MKNTINATFYFSLGISFIILFLPIEFKVGVYSPTILGWLWLFGFIPLTILTFIWAGINNYKMKEWKALKFRLIIFTLAVLFSVGYWLFLLDGIGTHRY